MTAANWPACIDFTLQFEGGYDAHPSDRGNWTGGAVGKGELKGTKYGIAAHVYPQLDIKNLAREQAIAIYRRDYWPKVSGDAQPAGVDLIAWDICVNSGAGRALAIERQALGSTIATATGLAALASSAPDKVAIVKRMCAARASFYRGLKTFDVFGKGWLRRNAAAEARGVALALAATAPKPAKIKQKLEAEGRSADKSKAANASGSVASGGGAAATQTTSNWPAFDWTTLGEIALCVVLLGVAGYFLWKAVAHNERAKAYAAAIKNIID
jgi:lysozyme family protein